MLTAVDFHNFKCFQTQSIELRPLTLLTGLNGMGKSTVLQGLLLLRQSMQQRMLPGQGLLLNGPLVRLGTAQNVLYEGAQEDELGLIVEMTDRVNEWRFSYEKPTADVLTVLKEPEAISDLVLFSKDFHYLTAERLGPRGIYEMSSYEVEQQHQMGPDGRYAVAYLETYARTETAPAMRHTKAVDHTLLSQVTAWLGEVSPGVQIKPEPFPILNRIALGVTFLSSPVESNVFSAPNVGFGLSYTLPVLVAVLSSHPGAFLLVENPEAHLHPQGQVAMGRLFACATAAGVQVVVETHSDHVLNGVRLAVKAGQVASDQVAVHFFQRQVEKDHFAHSIESPRIDRDGRLDFWPEGFFDQWEKSLDALLSE